MLGLKVLKHPLDSADQVVDVVLVHGLGGEAMKTWTSASGDFWPTWLQEWLCTEREIRNVRISTFGYNADFQHVFEADSVLGIDDFARQLLDGMNSVYKKQKVAMLN